MGMNDDGSFEIGTIYLQGWKAIAVIAGLAVLFLGFRTVQYKSVDEAADTIELWLVAEYTSVELEVLKDKGEDHCLTEEDAQSLLKAGRIEITSVHARGSGDDTVVRVEFTINGEEPPDGASPRYYYMNYSTITGWTMDFETSAMSYYLKLF